MTLQEQIQLAIDAREKAYAPYSDFHVGAALKTATGQVYTGCNIENLGFSATNCAERTAIFKAVSEGHREFESIVVVGGPQGDLGAMVSPCGVCRQVMVEFCDPETFKVILAVDPETYEEYTLKELLPLISRPKPGAGKEHFSSDMTF